MKSLADNDEPLLSGSGSVSKDVTDENLLDNWHEALTKWHQCLTSRPKQVHSLVRKGIPEALRGEVWQLLAGCVDNSDMLENYRILITKVCQSIFLCGFIFFIYSFNFFINRIHLLSK